MSRALGQNSLIPKCEQNSLIETAANSCVSRRQANDFFAVFFSIFELGGILKHLMTGPAGNSEFCFPSTSMCPVRLGEY